MACGRWGGEVRSGGAQARLLISFIERGLGDRWVGRNHSFTLKAQCPADKRLPEDDSGNSVARQTARLATTEGVASSPA